MNAVKKYRVTIDVLGIDVIALEHLSTVAHVLASKLDGHGRGELESYAGVLDGLTKKIRVAASTQDASAARAK